MTFEALFKELQAHLVEVAKDPSTFLNESLLEKFNLHFLGMYYHVLSIQAFKKE